MEYRGYTGTIHYSDEDGVFFGRVLGIRSMVSYEGETIAELFADFKAAVDDYYDICEADGWDLEQPKIDKEVRHFSGPNTLNYMDHTGSIEFDEESQLYHGRLTDIMGICGYSGIDLDHLKSDFKKAVDEYYGMMDCIYFDLGPGFPGIHKLLKDWFEGQTCAQDPGHPFVFREACLYRPALLNKTEEE